MIPRAEIEARQATQVLDLLATVPGLTVVQSGSPGKITSLFTRGANSNHTLVLWNGIELNDPSFGGFDWAHLPTEGVERIEVVRGPFSALYGSDAIGGVVQMLTGRDEGGRGAPRGRRERPRRWARSPPPHAVGRAAARRRRPPAPGRRRDRQRFLRQRRADRPRPASPRGPASRSGLVLRGGHSEIGVPRDFSGRPTPARHPGAARAPRSRCRCDFESGAVDARGAGRRGPRWTSSSAIPTILSRRSDTDAESAQGRAVVSWRPGGAAWIAGGVDWEREESPTASAFGPGLAGQSQRTWAAFAQGAFGRGPLRFDLGVRRDDNDAFGGETTLKAGRSGAPRDAVRLRASYGEGFHAPTLADLYFPGFSNPDLQPETSDS